MKYRRFGRLQWESSVLGLGLADLAKMWQGTPSAIDEPEIIGVLRYAIDRGVNYLHLDFPGDRAGREPVLRAVGRALQGGYREKVKFALTVPARLISSLEDFDRCLEAQLEWVGSDGADFCLLGWLTRDNWPALERLGILERLERAQVGGRLTHAGFSFHDRYQALKSVVEAYDRWSLCSVEYSYMDDNQPGASGITYAAERGLGVVVTRPFKGEALAADPPAAVCDLWAGSGRRWSPAEWALRFVLNRPDVSVAVTEMASAKQVDKNLEMANAAEVGGLSIPDEVTISKVRDAYRRRRQVPCPSCRPCMPCPQGIDVPRFFEIYNDAVMFDDVETARSLCENERIHPGKCSECGVCESRCVKKLPIVRWLDEGRRFLGLT